jgi:hypothetical protein
MKPLDRLIPSLLLPVVASVGVHLVLMTRQLLARGPFHTFDDAWGKIIEGYALSLPICLGVVSAISVLAFVFVRLFRPSIWIWGVLHFPLYSISLLTFALAISAPMDRAMLASIATASLGLGIVHVSLSLAGGVLLWPRGGGAAGANRSSARRPDRAWWRSS